MDAAARRWSSRRHTVVALTALAFVSFLVVLLHDSDNHSFVRHDRRHLQLVGRKGGPTPATTSTEASIIPASSSSSSSLAAPSSSSAAFSLSSAVSSAVRGASISPTIASSFSPVSSSTSVTVTPTSSISSSSGSSQSAQTSPSSTISSKTQPISSGTAMGIQPSQSTDRTPSTTLAISENVVPAIETSYSQPFPSSLITPTSTPVSAAVNSSGFWQKKGAVAATFVIVALVILAIIATLVISFLKRQSAHKQARIHDELFEKYSEPDHRGPSPGPSITSTPMDAFASREVRYDGSPSFQNYPAPQTQRAVHSSSPVQHPDYYNQPVSRYLAPSQTQAARSAAPPTAFRNPDNRDSYQHSIDSFYGAAGQPSTYNP